jgi:hypothetical protein
MDIAVGDILTMKKKHPCGSERWRVTRVGADFKLICEGCGREIMRPRPVVERSVRVVTKRPNTF